MKRNHISLLAVCAFIAAAGLSGCQAKEADDLADGLYAKIETAKGDIILKLEDEKAPLTVMNFVGLAEGSMEAAKGKRFYDGLSFHRVVDNFMIQGGDPEGSGRGGPGYQFMDEFNPELRHDKPGTLSMANSGPGTNGSQFFITHVSTPWLDDKHSIFGSVVKGQEVVNQIKQGDIMKKVSILRRGSKAKGYKVEQKSFDALQEELKAKKAVDAKDSLEKQQSLISANYSGMSEGASGLRYKILKQGSGSKPKAGQTVFILYKGMFADGRVFDSSEMSGNKPIDFPVGVDQVIPGFDLSAQDMRKGEKRLVVIPPELAYGDAGAGSVIPPYSYLVFELEITDIK